MEDEEDIRYDPGAWVLLAALAKKGRLTQTEVEEVTGLSRVWARRTRHLLEAWGLARSQHEFEGRVRFRVAYPTEAGLRVAKHRAELDAMLVKAKASAKKQAEEDED